MITDQANHIIAAVEQRTNIALDEEQKDQILLHEKGIALAQIQGSAGFEVLDEMEQSYIRGALEALAEIEPSQHDKVLAQHAIVFALTARYNAFQRDIRNAIQAAMKIPDAMKPEFTGTELDTFNLI